MASREIFSSFHRQWCLQRTQELSVFPFALFFREHPEKSVLSWDEYSGVIKNPMWFMEVLSRLKNDCYVYVDEWITDVVTIFDNAMAYNAPNSPGHDCAAILKRKFLKECLPVPNSEAHAKTIKKVKILKKLQGLLEHTPKSIATLSWDIEKLGQVEMEDLADGKWLEKREISLDDAWKAKIAAWIAKESVSV